MPWTRALREAREDDRARQVMHLEQLRTVQTASMSAITALAAQAVDARRQATSAQAEADARLVRDREAYLAALTAIRDVAEGQNRLIAELVGVAKEYLATFSTAAPQAPHSHTDLSEYLMEREALEKQALEAGFPLDLGPEAQLSWVLAQTDK